MQIEDLHFSVRIYHCLKRAGVDTVEQLSRMTDDELLHLRGFGVGCLAEVRAKIAVPRRTNADSIRAMGDEALVDFLEEIAFVGNAPWDDLFSQQICSVCPTVKGKIQETGQEMEFKECDFADGKCPHGSAIAWWLQQPAED